MHTKLLAPSETISFADVAHQTLSFDKSDPADALVLRLVDTAWVQRLRRISQTGNTKLVYMFAEHSRFGHSLGVAYLACELMRRLSLRQESVVEPYRAAVAAAAILHDVGHLAPGSHLAERVWSPERPGKHETVSIRVIQEDPEISTILHEFSPDLSGQVCAILADAPEMPDWTRAILSGSGWNADRGNWAIVDSAMCAVSYGRYNVGALLDAFRLTDDGKLVLQESRLDALTHFFVARDSMYRQIYQHRVLQAVDIITCNIARRARELIEIDSSTLFLDETMDEVLSVGDYAWDLPLSALFKMTEHWWGYHLDQWCESSDNVLKQLASRLRDRRLLKTIRLPRDAAKAEECTQQAQTLCAQMGFDPEYFLARVDEADKHRSSKDTPPLVLLDTGEIAPVTEIEPLIGQIVARAGSLRSWIAVPAEVKSALGKYR
jgi:HD superfamily phosphohydrolase